MRTARAAAAVVVLSLVFILSMGLVHAGPTGDAAGAEHVHEVAASVDEPTGEHDHHHHHGEPLGDGSGAPTLVGDVPHPDSHHGDDPHQHHLVDVDAGVVFGVLVAAPERAGAQASVTATSIPTSLSDGDNRPD